MTRIKKRHVELSSKLIEMGKALMDEGNEKKDFNISQTGSFIILIGNTILAESDVYLFGELCSMFSAKKILESMDEKNHDYTNFLKQKANDETYENLIKRINKIRDDNNLSPLE